MIGLYTKNDVLITRLIDTAVSYPDVIEVKNRTLDGQWHIQSIGTSATVLSVKAHLRLQEKDVLDTIKRNSDVLKVIFDGKYYIGLIDGKVDYERRKFTEHPMFGASFTVLVREEGDSV
jgi:hypothetical protein